MFPVLRMIQTSQSSVQCLAQSCPCWYSDNFHPDGLNVINHNVITAAQFLCCAATTRRGPKPGCLVGVSKIKRNPVLDCSEDGAVWPMDNIQFSGENGENSR